MAEASGITEDSLKQKITDLLQASYVDIEDMSGNIMPYNYPTMTLTDGSVQAVVARHSLLS